MIGFQELHEAAVLKVTIGDIYQHKDGSLRVFMGLARNHRGNFMVKWMRHDMTGSAGSISWTGWKRWSKDAVIVSNMMSHLRTYK